MDGPGGFEDPPPADCTTAILERVVGAAADTAALASPLGTDAVIRWGSQREVVVLDRHTCTITASYIAKYATKATEAVTAGTLVRPIRSRGQLDELDLPDHARRLILAAWTMAERTGVAGLTRWAHQFGYGGHTLTKSREYSVIFAALRAARVSWHDDHDARPEVVIRSQLTYVGRANARRVGP